eukprot:g12727.t1
MMRLDHGGSFETAARRTSCLPTSPEDITHRGVGVPTACVSGDLPLVALLLSEGAESGIDMLAPDSEGNTPLHYACLSDNPELILFLLRKAAATASYLSDSGGYENPRQKIAKARLLEGRNAASETPLLRAAVGGDVAVAKTLLVNT